MNFDSIFSITPPQIIERGEEYYDSGQVIEVLDDGKGNFIGKVAGSDNQEYEIVVNVDSKGEIDTYCDCPYNYETPCKHIIATLLEIQFSDQEYIVFESNSKMNYEDIINSISARELRQFVLDYADSDDKLRRELEEKFKR